MINDNRANSERAGPGIGGLPQVLVDWAAKADLKVPLTASIVIPHSDSTASPAVQFKSGSNVILLNPDYRGTVSFVDPLGNEIYIWWGVTGFSYEVKISGHPRVGDTQVCGRIKVPSGFPMVVAVNIHDLTYNPQDTIIGTGMTDDQGLFCLAITPPPLYQGQVLLAEVLGSWSQPVVVIIPVFLPITLVGA
jgi:hypothetical protein